MEKRLPLALFLCFAVLLGYQFCAATPPTDGSQDGGALEGAANETGQPGSTLPGTPADNGGESGEAGDSGDPAADPVGTDPTPTETPTESSVESIADSEARELELDFGTPGEPGSYWAKFTNVGGRLLELRLANYYSTEGLDDAHKAELDHWERLLVPVEQAGGAQLASLSLVTTKDFRSLSDKALDQVLWTMEELPAPERGVRFEYGPGNGLVFRKTLRHVPGSYEFEFQLEVENRGSLLAQPIEFFFTPAACVPKSSADKFYNEPKAIAAGRDGDRGLPSTTEEAQDSDPGSTTGGALSVEGNYVHFAGVHNKYFAFLLRGADARTAVTLRSASWRQVFDAGYVADLGEPDPTAGWRFITTDVRMGSEVPATGSTTSHTYRIFAGPKSREVLSDAGAEFEALALEDLGFFDGIASFLLKILNFFQGIVGNWGVSIILLTLTVRLVLFPINRRSQTAMARYQTKMKRVQPRLNALKEKYKDDRKRQQQEQAKIMQEEGAFPPLGGCLPMFLQIPVFFALFSALRTSFDLRHASFLWVTDLSMPDRLLKIDFDTHLPIIGTIEYLNILPPFMVLFWVLQQRMMPKPADEQAARMQRMMMWMPVMMGFFLYSYAAGLSLYMITQSLLGILETGFIKKKWPVDDAELEKKKEPGGCMGFMMRAQEEQQRRMREAQKQGGGRPGGGGKGGGKSKKRR